MAGRTNANRRGLDVRAHLASILTLMLLVVSGCSDDFTRFRGADVPIDVKPNEWWHERGPVVPHDSFPSDCSLCHVGATWNVVRDDFEFDHLAETGVALEGAHARAECLRCHNDRGPAAIFTSRGCAGCHEDPHRSQLGTSCDDCHGNEDWQPNEQIAMHSRTRFPLVGAHAATACFSCHEGAQVGNFSRTDTECVTCHASDLSKAKSPDHVAQGWVDSCDECHVPTSWAGAGFVHDSFPLQGAHAATDCAACHSGSNFIGTPNDCYSCHQPDYDGAQPDHTTAGFPTDCDACHNVAGWQGAAFVHDAWPLTGAHSGTNCEQCHVGGVYEGTPTECVDCHQADYNGVSDPDHAGSGFPTTCEDCHGTGGWQGAFFDHASWPLTGAHSGTDCTSCHESGVYVGTPTDCVSCHQSDYAGTTNPDHDSAGFATTCDDCHDTGGWAGAFFTHPMWPLTGAHSAVDCAQCHVGGVYGGTSTDCVSCHQADYDGASDPNHVASGFPTTCEDCHSTGGWDGAFFSHTSWPLTGAHSGTDCTECHIGSVYIGTPTECIQCHESDYDSTSHPNHVAAGFPTDCEACHDTASFNGATFNHSSWPLTGAHNGASCEECHVGGVYIGTPNDCIACHQSDFTGTTNPDHEAAGFATTCDDCHDTGGWAGAFFTHPMWPLTGAHSAIDCTQCHVGGVYGGTSTDCVSCHQSDYDGANDPNHVASGFPTTCEDCHTTGGWDGATFNHTSWPLTGAHSGANCTECHVGGVYIGTPTNCIQCHESDYNSTNDPDHAAAGFPTDCEACHTTNTWNGATFSHSSWPLTGAHNGANCAECHVGGQYIGTPTDCIACHQDDYDGTRDPDHAAAGFPIDCTACHTTNTWDGATFQHDFPITTGKHKNFDCAECHVNPGNFVQFSCIDCHEHNQSSMNSEHHNVNNYVWASSACYQCHPKGKE